MMRVLHITPEAPGSLSGGKIGVKQSLYSLVDNKYVVDYVGPEIEEEEIRQVYNHLYFLEPSNNLPLRIYDSLHMNTNRRYGAWKNLKLDMSGYDIILLEFTKLNYVLQHIPKEKLIVRVHNVEVDYSYQNFRHNKRLINLIDYIFAGIRERQIVKSANMLMVLTKKDKERLSKLYEIAEGSMEILPVCVREPKDFSINHDYSGELKMLINGSLWFGPNYEGIKWFLDNIFNKINFPKRLIIAGSKPNGELIERVKRLENVELVDSPVSMEPYFLNTDISIAPVFNGAGMKVKVAEALSYGLPVVGTTHAFEGYKITHGVDSYSSDDVQGFLHCINEYAKLSYEEKTLMRERCFNLFRSFYSQSHSNQIFRQSIEALKS